MNPSTAPPASLSASARALAAQGRHQEAEHAFRTVLESDPDQAEALIYLASRALFAQQPEAAISLLQRACRAHPDDVGLLRNLGAAYAMAGHLEQAQDALRQAVQREPGFCIARLQLGNVLERQGQAGLALLAYVRAIHDAQAQGQWHDEASTPPWLRGQVTQAMRYVTQQRPGHFLALLEPVRAEHGAASLQRVERCLLTWLGDLQQRPADPRQRPTFLYFPGLPETPYLDRAQFDWIPALEAQTATIRQELLNILADEQGVEPFNRYADQAQLDASLRGLYGAPAWNAYFFYRHGERVGDNHKRCPQTAQVLEGLPLVRIREHSPEVCFSMLTPGTHILPHTGITNTRVVAHLPLLVPPDCALTVAGQAHVWQEGQVLVFDDTFEHEAWNRSQRTRAILLMDLWNPDLNEAERQAVTLLVGSIGDYNRSLRADLPLELAVGSAGPVVDS